MAYSIGTASTAAALRLIIEDFAVTNGFTLNAGAGSWLSKGQTHVRLTTSTITGASSVIISAANSADGATELCPYTKCITIIDADWPVSYELFYSPTPDQVTCVVNHATTKIQMMVFGDIVKVHTDAYVGGNWFFASQSTDEINKLNYGLDIFSDTQIMTVYSGSMSSGARQGSNIPFTFTKAGTYGSYNAGDYSQSLHCKIDGRIWGDNSTITQSIFILDSSISLAYRSPNTWNSQANLVTIGLQFSMTSSLYGYLGYIEHLRLIRVDNYNIGDIITLGTDQWKVYPWFKKNSSLRNGITANVAQALVAGSGTLGFAVRYVV